MLEMKSKIFNTFDPAFCAHFWTDLFLKCFISSVNKITYKNMGYGIMICIGRCLKRKFHSFDV